MSLNPRKHSVSSLVSKLDDLSREEIEELKAAELAGRGRKSLLEAIDAALGAHAELEEKLDEIVEQSEEEAPVDVLAGVSFAKSALGWSASGGVVAKLPDFGCLNFGSEDACRNALAVRVLSRA